MSTGPATASPATDMPDGDVSLLDVLIPIAESWKSLCVVPILAGLMVYGGTFLIKPTFTATTTFLPPQQQQGSASAAALASLGALSGLAGAVGGIKTAGDQYVALLQSVSVTDRIIDSFKLIDVYDVKYRQEARKDLAKNVRVTLGKRDGLISIDVDDEDPRRAADIANRHVEELRRVTNELALTEAQQRRKFFEQQLSQTKSRLAEAQQALQSSGYSAGALRSEPRAAAETYARLKAEVTAAEVRLQTLRRGLADSAAEVQQQLTLLAALSGQLAKLEGSAEPSRDADYIGRYREFKYQETLFELFSRQFELARLDESREGALIQVVDTATPPEKRSRPRRVLLAAGGATLAALGMLAVVLVRHRLRSAASDPATAQKLERLRMAWRGR